MDMTIQRSRAIAAVTAAALALTSFSVAPAAAAPKAATQAQTANAQTSTDFSSHRRRYYRGNAAGAAAFAAIVGGIATYAAAREYRKAREREYQYRYGYYGAPYGYYDHGPRYRHWRGW
jgi:hypothetical protein